MEGSATAVSLDDDEMSIADALLVLSRQKKLLIRVPLAITVLTAAVTFALPNVYKGTAVLLPPQQAQSGAAALLSQLGGVAGMAAGVANIKNPGDLYVGMLQSRTIADKLISKFNLKKVYVTDSQEIARKKLDENTTITAGKDGFITIDVQDTDKELVAPLANAYTDELLQLSKTLAVTEASQRRVFFERELEQAKNNLATAEAKLKTGLATRGVTSVEGETRAIVETVGRLRAQVSAKEIQLNSMKPFVTASNPDYRRVEEELSSLRAELLKLENGQGKDDESSPVGSHGLNNIKLLRDVKYYEMLYELLAKQYEVARLDEAKDPSIIQVLDPAVEPEKKFKPKRTLIVLLAGFIGVILAIVAAFVREAVQRVRSTIKTRLAEEA